jgi:hypothetical protein
VPSAKMAWGEISLHGASLHGVISRVSSAHRSSEGTASSDDEAENLQASTRSPERTVPRLTQTAQKFQLCADAAQRCG